MFTIMRRRSKREQVHEELAEEVKATPEQRHQQNRRKRAGSDGRTTPGTDAS